MESLFGSDDDLFLENSNESSLTPLACVDKGTPSTAADSDNQASHNSLFSDDYSQFVPEDPDGHLSESEGSDSASEFEPQHVKVKGHKKRKLDYFFFITAILIFFVAERLTVDQVKLLIAPTPPGELRDQSNVKASESSDNENSCNHSLAGEHSSGEVLEFMGCTILHNLNMYWCPALLCVVSKANETVVLGTTLPKVMEEEAVEHVRKAFAINMSEGEDAFWSRIKDKVLLRALHGLPVPRERSKCNVCNYWFVNMSKHKNHKKNAGETEHAEGIAKKLPQHSTQCLFSQRRRQSYCLRVAEDAQPEPTPPTIPTSYETETEAKITPLSIPRYIHKIQWLLWLKDVDANAFMDTLEITEGPSKARRKQAAEGSSVFKVEDTLFRIRKNMTTYLMDADVRMSSSNAALRVAVTSG